MIPRGLDFDYDNQKIADFPVELIQKLDEVRIGTRLLFAGNLVRQPSMTDQTYRVAAGLDVTDQVMHDTFWVGIHPA